MKEDDENQQHCELMSSALPPRRNSMILAETSYLLNPKPLVGSDSLPRRRHSIGSDVEFWSSKSNIASYVDNAVINALRRRKINSNEDVSADSIPRATQEYRIKLADLSSNYSLSCFGNNNNNEEEEQQQQLSTTPIPHDTAAPSSTHPSKRSTRRSSRRPCWFSENSSSSSSTAAYDKYEAVLPQLHSEILDYAEYTKSVVSKMAVQIESTIRNVRECVSGLWTEASVETFGSYSTGLWLPDSDVDLVVLGVTKQSDESHDSVPHLKTLATVLSSQSWVESILVVETAKVPVIKIVSSDTGVPIDITFESHSTHSGLLARDLISGFLKEMPEVYPMAIVIKQLLRERGLNEAYTGGLSSYSTVLMIVHFNQLWRAGPKALLDASVYASGGESCLSAMQQEEHNDQLRCNEGQMQSTSSSDTNIPNPPLIKSYAAAALHQPSEKLQTQMLEENKPLSYAAAAAAPRGKAGKKGKKKAVLAVPSTTTTTTTASSSPAGSLSPQPRMIENDDVSVATTDSEADDASMVDEACLGERLVRFFEFFGIIFNYQVSGMSVRNGGFIYRSGDEESKPALVIEDPIYPSHNVGACSFAILKVASCLEDSYYTLKYFRPSRFSPSALSCLLHPKGHEFKECWDDMSRKRS